jgi:replicative DNA helicase
MNEKILDKLWSLSGEAGVIGSMILDRDVMPKVLSILPDGNLFYKPEHQRIFDSLMELYMSGKPLDAIMLRDELERRGQLAEVGGVDYIARILDSVPSSANAEYYSRIVKERWQYRQLVDAIENMQKVVNEPLDIGEQVEQIRQLALALNVNHQQNGCYTLKDSAEKVATSIAKTDSNIPTGYRNIDRVITGIRTGELIIIAGRPSMGKSGLALQIALSAAKNGISVLFVSLEMGHRSLIERAIGMVGDINVSALKNFPQTDRIYEQANEAAHVISKYDLTIHEGLNTPEKLVSFVIEQKKIHKVDIVFVDYLQLMSAKGKVENRVAEISAISRQLKTLAMDEAIPVVALSQLNRECESRVGHRPRLSDLRDSGSIEQDADIVLLLHREDYYRLAENPSGSEPDGIVEIIIAKNRRGPTGIAKLVFLPETVKFGDLSEGQDDE